MKKIHPKHLPMEVLIKYKNSSNVDYVIQRKKIIQGFIINKIEIIHAKNVFFFFFLHFATTLRVLKPLLCFPMKSFNHGAKEMR